MQGKLVFDHQRNQNVCVSCHLFNCWHLWGEPCDIDGCECARGSDILNQ